MFGRLEVDLGVRQNSILIPEGAISELQGKNFVWVVGPENKAVQRPVTVGETIGGAVLITEGLKAGEPVVVEGLQKLRDGAVVEPVPAGSAGQKTENAAEKQ